ILHPTTQQRLALINNLRISRLTNTPSKTSRSISLLSSMIIRQQLPIPQKQKNTTHNRLTTTTSPINIHHTKLKTQSLPNKRKRSHNPPLQNLTKLTPQITKILTQLINHIQRTNNLLITWLPRYLLT